MNRKFQGVYYIIGSRLNSANKLPAILIEMWSQTETYYITRYASVSGADHIRGEGVTSRTSVCGASTIGGSKL